MAFGREVRSKNPKNVIGPAVMNIRSLLVLLALSALVLASPTEAAGPPNQRPKPESVKIIQMGYGTPLDTFVRDNAGQAAILVRRDATGPGWFEHEYDGAVPPDETDLAVKRYGGAFAVSRSEDGVYLMEIPREKGSHNWCIGSPDWAPARHATVELRFRIGPGDQEDVRGSARISVSNGRRAWTLFLQHRGDGARIRFRTVVIKNDPIRTVDNDFHTLRFVISDVRADVYLDADPTPVMTAWEGFGAGKRSFITIGDGSGEDTEWGKTEWDYIRWNNSVAAPVVEPVERQEGIVPLPSPVVHLPPAKGDWASPAAFRVPWRGGPTGAAVQRPVSVGKTRLDVAYRGPMEWWTPDFAGFIIGAELRGDCAAKSGREFWDTRFCWVVFGKGRVEWENVAEAVENLKQGAARFSRPQEMFLRFNVIPGNVDWLDDEGWASVRHNAAIAGRMVREAGLRGVFFDIEEYGKAKYGQARPFQYAAMALCHKKSFDEYALQVRARGRQWIHAFQKEAPAAVIIFAWAHGHYGLKEFRKRQSGELKPDETMEVADTGYLLAPFVDGVLEDAEDDVRIFDGFEHSYGFRTESDFRRARDFIRGGWRFSQIPDVYKRKMHAAFGIELDRRYNQRGGFHPDRPEVNYWTPKTLADALHWAMLYCDGYIWVYSQAIRFWPPQNWRGDYARVFAEARKELPFGREPEEKEGITDQIITGRGSPNPTAAQVRGPDPEVLFKDLWSKHRLAMDLPLQAKFRRDPDNVGEKEGWAAPPLDDRTWTTIRVDEFWQHQGHAGYTRFGWYRLTFKPPADLPKGKRILLAFGASDETTDVFLNGKKLFAWFDWNRPFQVDVTEHLKPDTDSLLAVKVFGGPGMGGLWAPIKLVVER